MSKIVNEAKVKFPLFVKVREQLEHRALWMYLLVDEAKKRGLDDSFAEAAIRRCGNIHGDLHVAAGKTTSLKGLRKVLFTKSAQIVFEMDVVECTDDKLSIDFHYCPLVKAWQKQGCSDEEIERLSDLAMCGDRGIGESFGVELDLPKTIARGDDCCAIRYIRRQGSAESRG
ncbi:MAG: L-2-amino-thiazoline-4-carboxylic acid hydrolase [Eggerthellaceae bacterium]|nr:L-2-amino-thiazoline-4-carboxylic acid hydrolase [Eggerthellaceae bacterium]